MRIQWQKGASNLDAYLIIAFIIFVILVSPKTRTPGNSSPSWNVIPSNTSGSNYSYTNAGNSNYGSQGIVYGTQIVSSDYNRAISINRGNASYVYQPSEEYISLNNTTSKPIDISGWLLRNGKDRRVYNFNGTEQKFAADVAVIPQATTLYSNAYSALQDIVLNPGERAYVTTGTPTVHTPYSITSFKENICTGYIENHPDYNFTPSLELNCPRPEDEQGVANLDNQCRNFIRNLPRCTNPVFESHDANGDVCTNCVNGTPLSNSCVSFIKSHYTYQGCLANHGGDKNFYGNTWRIFLGRGWEMWATEYETIELMDRLGNLVNYENY